MGGHKAIRSAIGTLLVAAFLMTGCEKKTTQIQQKPEPDVHTKALCDAIINSNKTNVTKALDKGADPNELCSNYTTPLVNATLMNQAEIAKILLEKGADVNKISNGVYAPLIAAIGFGHTDLAKMYIEKGANVNVNTETTAYSPLMTAISTNNEELVKMLKAAGATGTEQELAKAELFGAILENDVEKVKSLLDDNKVNVEAIEWIGEDSPLRMAATKGHAELVQLLIKHGADVNAKSATGITALQAATNWGREDIVKMLVEAGAKPDTN